MGFEGSSNCYHVMSRTAGGDKVFEPREREAFVKIMRRMERFSGVEILTHAVMANHFHILVKVPERMKFLERFDGPEGEAELMKHLELLYSENYLAALRAELSDLRAKQMSAEAEELLERFRVRFCSLPLFVKELKERFTRWFNRVHNRKGTLWMERFKSVIVEDGEALRTMACYIDLNPVRAGLVEDPKDYRWCGYAEAVAGEVAARRGLCQVMDRPRDGWDSSQGPQGAARDAEGPSPAGALYRSWLFERGIATESRRGVSEKARNEVRKREGGLTRGELLRCKVRYFTDGVAIGSREFVESLFRERRNCFGETRKDGARVIKEAPGLNLFSLRTLNVRAVDDGGSGA